MPCSDNEGKDWALDVYRELAPASVVDLGPGAGTYAQLMRPEHQADWTAVGVWGRPYVSEFKLDQLYDKVVVADIRYVDFERVATAPDLVIAGDVVEHLERDECLEFVQRLVRWSRNVLVLVPIDYLPQSPDGLNHYESRLYHWSFDDMCACLDTPPARTWRGDLLAYCLRTSGTETTR